MSCNVNPIHVNKRTDGGKSWSFINRPSSACYAYVKTIPRQHGLFPSNFMDFQMKTGLNAQMSHFLNYTLSTGTFNPSVHTRRLMLPHCIHYLVHKISKFSSFLTLKRAISRTTGPVLFVLIWMHFSCWVQIYIAMKFCISKFFEKVGKFQPVVWTRHPREEG